MGKTIRCAAQSASPKVHPHGCGEDIIAVHARRASQGSPPRVWGRLVAGLPLWLACRFTPTGVGKTCGALEVAAGTLVHPHGCGEDAAAKASIRPSCGSPPRVWGRRRFATYADTKERFTPTGVGKTTIWHRCREIHKVHPHGCGEDFTFAIARSCAFGSPPRVWGRQGREPRNIGEGRFTPTGVGKTRRVCLAVWRWKVHPHGCGEDWM